MPTGVYPRTEYHKAIMRKRIMPEDLKQRLRLLSLGRHPSEETRKKLSLSHMGNTNTKGKKMQTEEYKNFLREKMKGNKYRFKKGSIPWNKGLGGSYGWTDEQRKKHSELKKRQVVEGNNNFYIDGRSKYTRTERMQIMSKLEYKLWRESVFKRDGYKCFDCGESGYLEAHHIIPFKTREKILDINNGITLCRPCHKKTMGKELELAQIYFSLVQVQL